jgi:hypothetical protein
MNHLSHKDIVILVQNIQNRKSTVVIMTTVLFLLALFVKD